MPMTAPVLTPPLPEDREFNGRLSGWLFTYGAATPGCACGSSTWLMSANSAPQPDFALMILPEHGGQSKIEGKYWAGAPELVVEVSHTTYARSGGVKRSLYERNGVREYVIVQPIKRKLVWNVLVQNKYQELAADAGGLLRSPLFPGLWLNPAQLWNGDLQGMVTTVQQGVASAPHAAFVRKLARRKQQ